MLSYAFRLDAVSLPLHWTLNGCAWMLIYTKSSTSTYMPPPTRLQTSDLLVFPHSNFYAGGFSSPHTDWGYNNNSADGDSRIHGQILTI